MAQGIFRIRNARTQPHAQNVGIINMFCTRAVLYMFVVAGGVAWRIGATLAVGMARLRLFQNAGHAFAPAPTVPLAGVLPSTVYD